MITAVIMITLLFTVLILSYKISALKTRARIKRKHIKDTTSIENPKKSALNIPGYYEDIVNKDKLTRNYKWELHDSI